MRYTNNSGLELEVIHQVGKQCTVRFIASGATRKANIDNIRAGKVKDLYSPSRYGVGFDGDVVRVAYWKKAKQLWSNMLKRCYCESDPKGYFGKTVVDPRWHNFSLFLLDLPSLPGFVHWERGENYQLDKDLLGDGSVYSRDVCSFLSEHHNKSLQPNYRIDKVYNKVSGKWE